MDGRPDHRIQQVGCGRSCWGTTRSFHRRIHHGYDSNLGVPGKGAGVPPATSRTQRDGWHPIACSIDRTKLASDRASPDSIPDWQARRTRACPIAIETTPAGRHDQATTPPNTDPEPGGYSVRLCRLRGRYRPEILSALPRRLPPSPRSPRARPSSLLAGSCPVRSPRRTTRSCW